MLLLILTAVLLVLKLLGMIAISWGWVFAPAILAIVLWLLAVIGASVFVWKISR